MLLALAGQRDKCELIAQGVDVYRDMASTIYGLDRLAFMAIAEDDLSPEQSEQRRIGKNGVLSSGYGIGAESFYRRFCNHGRRQGTRRPDCRRLSTPVGADGSRLWRDLEYSARRAMQQPGQPVVARCGVTYELTTRVGLPCLTCSCSTGNTCTTSTPGWTGSINSASRAGSATPSSSSGAVEPYGGLLTENVVSALSRELLVNAMFALEAAGYPIVLTVHDEIIIEHADISKEIMQRIMSERPAWAEKLGVPIRAKAWIGKRYRK